MAWIPLRARDGHTRALVAVDDADADWLNQWRWSLSIGGRHRDQLCAVRAIRRDDGGRTTVKMHRQIMGFPPCEVDHVNGDTLDNHRENLRLATHGQNAQNVEARVHSKSGIRGVSWNKARAMWVAQVQLDGEYHHFGYFATAEDAHAVVSAWRAKHMPYSKDARTK
jgi:hypothetical protein